MLPSIVRQKSACVPFCWSWSWPRSRLRPPPDDPAPATFACEWWDYLSAFIYGAITLAGGISLAVAGGIRTGAAWVPEWLLARGNRAIGETFLGLLIVVGGLAAFGWMVSSFFSGQTNCWDTGGSAALIAIVRALV
jgi:hypothetical protein